MTYEGPSQGRRGQDDARHSRGPGRPANPMSVEDVRRAAAVIMAEKGYQATTIRDIAEALGVRKATIHHHIGSKANLLFSLIEQLQLPGREIMQQVAAAEGDPRARLHLFVELTLSRIAENPIVSRILVHEFRYLEGEYLERATAIRSEYEQFLTALILEGQASGDFNAALDPVIAAINTLLMLNSLNEWYRPKGRYGLDKIIEAVAAMVLSGLSPAPLPNPRKVPVN